MRVHKVWTTPPTVSLLTAISLPVKSINKLVSGHTFTHLRMECISEINHPQQHDRIKVKLCNVKNSLNKPKLHFSNRQKLSLFSLCVTKFAPPTILLHMLWGNNHQQMTVNTLSRCNMHTLAHQNAQ